MNEKAVKALEKQMNQGIGRVVATNLLLAVAGTVGLFLLAVVHPLLAVVGLFTLVPTLLVVMTRRMINR